MKAARIFILAIASCISRKESSSLVDETQVFLSNDNQNDTNIYNKITLFDSMLKEFDYLFSFYCFADRMKKRYDSKWFVDHQTTAEDVQPYYFLHIHKNGGMTVVKELDVLLKDEYWCQSESSYISGIKDKSIFPYKKPRVITFIRKPLDQVLSSYRMGYDLAIAKGRSREDMRMDKKLVGDIDHCFDDKTCTDRYANFQSRILGGSFNQRKFWFVGMTEMMYTSLCLLKYKMGVYNSTLCDCSSRTSSKIPHEDHHYSHVISPSSISRNTKQVILSHSKQDIQIYDASYQFFVEELHSAETQSGIDFNCSSVFNCATC